MGTYTTSSGRLWEVSLLYRPGRCPAYVHFITTKETRFFGDIICIKQLINVINVI